MLQAAGDLSTIGSLFDDTAGGLAVYIDASGGTIDTQGYSVSCNKAIQHGSGSPTDGGLTKIGSGTLILSQQNTYTGPTTVSGGLLVLSSGGYATPSSGSIYVNGGTLSVNQENTWADSTITSGPAVTVNAGGVMTNGSGYAFTLINPTLSGGTLVANSGDGPTWGSFGMKGTITVNGVQTSAINAGAGSNMFVNIGANSNPNGGDATFLVTSNASPGLVVNVPLADMGNGAGSNGLVKSGSGSLVLTAANTYSGNTTVNGGTLSIGGGGLLGGGSYSGTLAIGSGATFCYSSSATQTLGGAFSGAGNLVQMGAGVLTLTCNYNNSTCTGSVTVSGGTLVLGNDSAIANASALVINNGATVQTTYYNELGLTPPPVTINAGGQLLRNNSSNATRLGSLTLAGGTLGAMAYDTAGSAFWLQGDVNVTANSTISAVTNLVNPSQSFNVSAGATLNVTGNIISNSGYGLTLAGPGALTLAASACQYSGPTYVNGGTLGLSGAGSLAGTMFVAGGSLGRQPRHAQPDGRCAEYRLARQRRHGPDIGHKRRLGGHQPRRGWRGRLPGPQRHAGFERPHADQPQRVERYARPRHLQHPHVPGRDWQRHVPTWHQQPAQSLHGYSLRQRRHRRAGDYRLQSNARRVVARFEQRSNVVQHRQLGPEQQRRSGLDVAGKPQYGPLWGRGRHRHRGRQQRRGHPRLHRRNLGNHLSRGH